MQKLGTFIFLFLICLVIYANIINGEFLLDDNDLIINNQYIKQLRTIPLLFITNLWRFSLDYPDNVYIYYRPLQTLSYALDYSIYQLNPAGFHFTNILIHAINAFLVFYLLFRLFNNYQIALLSSLLFSVHPIQTEAVSYIAGRSELLVSLFILLSLVFYLGYLNSRKNSKYLLSIASLVLALLSRETGLVILIPLFVIFVGLRLKLSKRRLWLHFLSFTGIILIYGVLRLTVLVPIEQLPYKFLGFPLDFLNLLHIIIKYIQLLIFPYPLYVLRTVKPITSFWSLSALGPLLLLLLLITALVISWKQKKHILLFAISWFILTASYLMQAMYKFTSRLSMEEHWFYLPSVGFFIIVAYLLLNIPIKRIGRIIAVFIIIISCILTIGNNLHWKKEIDFYRYNLRFIEPGFSRILRINLAAALEKKGLYNQAIREMRILSAIDPNDWLTYIILGGILEKMQRYPEAIEAYNKALKIDPFCWQANRRLKRLTEETGQVYKEEPDPTLSPIETNILSHLKMGEFDKALEILYRELSISPSPQLYILAGITFGKMGKCRQAIEAFNAALKLDPQNIRALYNLSVVYERIRQFKKADEIHKIIEQIK